MAKTKLNRLVFDVVRADNSDKYEVFLLRCDKPTHIEYLIRREIGNNAWSCHGLDNVAAPSKKSQKVLFSFLESIKEALFAGAMDFTQRVVIEDKVQGSISHLHFLTPE